RPWCAHCQLFAVRGPGEPTKRRTPIDVGIDFSYVTTIGANNVEVVSGLACTDEGELVALRGPHWAGAVGRNAPPDPSGRGHHFEPASAIDGGCLRLDDDQGKCRSIRRPGGTRLVVRAAGDLTAMRPVAVDSEHMEVLTACGGVRDGRRRR